MFAVIGVAGIEPATDVVEHHEKMRSDEHFALYLFVGIVAVVGTSLMQYTYTTFGSETREALGLDAVPALQ